LYFWSSVAGFKAPTGDIGKMLPMLGTKERSEIDRLWARKLQQDAQGLPQPERHRNLEPSSAEFIHALAAGMEAKRILEIGGSSGISTIALAAAARLTGGRVISIEREPVRQADARQTIARLGLDKNVDFVLDDASAVIPGAADLDLAFIDCEKEDYVRFFDALRMRKGGIIVADNIISHSLSGYVAHARRRPGAESITLEIGKGLELTRV
jgi:predicted O-methyltransferase YrrM